MIVASQPPALIVVDWGTTNLRAFLVDHQGRSLDSVSSDEGLLQVDGDFGAVLGKHIGAWLQPGGALAVVISGMAGSRSGWVEVPYVPCPFTTETLATALYQVNSFNAGNTWIVPGVSGTSASGQFDVMRGEEVQILGALSQLAVQGRQLPDFICLPGTHNKWVSLVDGVLQRFSTTMTGELFNLLSSQSILAQSVDVSAPWDEQAYLEGIRISGCAGGLLHQLFSVRARQLNGELQTAQGTAYLSGLLIGSEIRSMFDSVQRSDDQKPCVCVVASQQLTEKYFVALQSLNIAAYGVSSQHATLAGALNIARNAQLI